MFPVSKVWAETASFKPRDEKPIALIEIKQIARWMLFIRILQILKIHMGSNDASELSMFRFAHRD